MHKAQGEIDFLRGEVLEHHAFLQQSPGPQTTHTGEVLGPISNAKPQSHHAGHWSKLRLLPSRLHVKVCSRSRSSQQVSMGPIVPLVGPTSNMDKTSTLNPFSLMSTLDLNQSCLAELFHHLASFRYYGDLLPKNLLPALAGFLGTSGIPIALLQPDKRHWIESPWMHVVEKHPLWTRQTCPLGIPWNAVRDVTYDVFERLLGGNAGACQSMYMCIHGIRAPSVLLRMHPKLLSTDNDC